MQIKLNIVGTEIYSYLDVKTFNRYFITNSNFVELNEFNIELCDYFYGVRLLKEETP